MPRQLPPQIARHEYLALLGLLDEQAGVTECDLQGRITRVNKRFERLSGYRRAELLGQDHRLLSSGQHDAAFWQTVWARLLAGEIWHGELCNRAKDGQLFWEDTVIAPLPGPDGQTCKYIAVRRDISAAKRDRAALQTSRALLAHAGRLAGVGGWVLDLDSRCLQLSAECRQILASGAPEMLPLDEARDYFNTEQWLSLRAALESAALRRKPFDRVVQIGPSGAATRWLRVVGETEPDQDPPRRVIGAIQDISALTLAQRYAEAGERTLRSAIEALGEAFALYDADERLLFCNERYRQLVSTQRRNVLPGLSYEDVLRLAFRESERAPVTPDAEAWIAERLRQFRQNASDSQHLLSDGRWIRAINRRTADGLHVVFRLDISESRRALEAAGAAARSKSQFLANMSHEIRTPLNAVLGMLQLLGHTALDAEQSDLLGKADGAARHLLALLNSILDYSKAEAGKMVLELRPFELPRLLRELRTLLEAQRGDKPLRLLIDTDPALPDWLLGDALRLQQVLINLGGNAIKFTERGEVRLRLRLLAREPAGLAVEFELSDTGIGIAPAQQREIFGAFSQAEASTARRYGGTGLGLAISQRLLQLMGSELHCESRPGRGSRFFFTLRLAVAAAAPAAPAAPGPRAAARLAGLRLLLAEDNALNRELVLRLLGREGAQIDCAADGRQALEALQRHDYDLVLMDMQMPGMDGLQACRALRREPRWARLPVLAMSANTSPADRAACLAAGMDEHLGKPFDLEQLVATIRRLCAADPPPVLDSAGALARLGQDTAFYAQLLRQFAAQAEPLLQRLTEQHDRAAAHQLKGIASALGAQRLAAACALAETDAGRIDAQGLRAELAAVLQAQAGWLAAHAVAPAAAAMDLEAALHALAVSLESHALDSFERYDALLAGHAGVLGEALAPLRQAMEGFDTEAAVAACRQLLADLTRRS